MNFLMIWVTIWHWGTSLMQMMIMKPTETSNSKVLRTIKTHTITSCWLACQQTTGCGTIATDSDSEKMNDLTFDCYILGSGENKPKNSKETPLKVTDISPFNVSHSLQKSARIRIYSGPYSVRMRENTDQNKSEYGHFSRSDFELLCSIISR